MGASVGNPSEFGPRFLRAAVALEDAVLELLCSGWDETLRARAYEMAVALTQAAKAEGWWETESTLRALSSILSLSVSEILSIRQAARDKLLELLLMVKKVPASRSA